MGFVLSSYFAALIIGIPLSSWVGQLLGWRSIFWASSGLSLLLLLASLFSFAGVHLPEVRKRFPVLKSYRQVLGTRVTMAALGVSFTVSGGTLTFLTYISGYLNSEFGLGAIAISSVFAVSGVGAVLASPLSGWLSDKSTKRRVFLISNTVLVLPLLAVTELDWGLPLYAVLLLISLCISFRQTSLQTLQTQLISTKQRGTFLALRNCFSQMGISVGVLVGGQLYSTEGYGAVTLLAAGLTVAGSLLMYLMVPEPSEHLEPTAGTN
jgi:DHA1 family inner membrane transport protein